MRTSMNATCVITDPARTTRGPWDEQTGSYGPPVPFQVYPDPQATEDAPCRVQRIASGREAVQAGVQVEYRGYLITIPADAPAIHPDYEVHVTDAINDPNLPGEMFTVTDVLLGSERFERDLFCTHNESTEAVNP
ncbi:DUF6093 family protein [Ruania rhizosphaerae]|uniref:DUF6093 family protein n=1 Tax=Ruania rhizosphaerae TaxID=1840413 RepID=UPI0013585B8E|nr:DUF6093 family protein [Ruania rhizosphaerae]